MKIIRAGRAWEIKDFNTASWEFQLVQPFWWAM